MSFKELIKKHRFDIILGGVVSLLCVIAISVFAGLRNRGGATFAKIYLKNQLIEEINLVEAGSEEKDITIHGEHGDMIVTYHTGEIKVSKSNCPHQYCVHKGYINTASNPIICTYNAVYIVIEGASSFDVII